MSSAHRLSVAAFFFLCAFIPRLVLASCAGVEGCNPCYDSLLGTEKEDVACVSDSDCVAIPHRCGGFYALNRARAMKFRDEKLKPDQTKVSPVLICRLSAGWGVKVCQPRK